jgi:aminodeoxyfutalosine deaminase
MRKITADWIFPGNAKPLSQSVIVVNESGIVKDVLNRSEAGENIEVFEGIICPGFVNAHCHLELSYMKNRIQRKKGLAQFIRDLLSIRNEKIEIVLEEINKADEEMWQNGIVAVGDISNDDHSLDQKTKSKIYYHTFVEAYGFVPEKTNSYFQNALNVFSKAREKKLSASITPHAPYSVPPALFKMIFDFTKNHPAIFSIHNQETQAETDFFRDGKGDFKILIEDFFKLNPIPFSPTGKRSLESVINFFPVKNKMLLVHNTMSRNEDFENAVSKNKNLWWCTCPNANLFIEDQLPQYDIWMECTENICIGTDSLASNLQLSILDEMKTIQKHNPEISTETLIKWATWNGAKFLGIENQFGSIEKGRQSGILLLNKMQNAKLTNESVVKRLI